MGNGKVNNITWQTADELLTSIIGWQPSSLDAIHKIAREKSCLVAKVGDWENLSDSEILKYIHVDQYISGQVYIITDLSYINKLGVFKLSSRYLYEFVNEYSKLYFESFFNGDVIFISPEKKVLLTFQHDGNCILLKLPLPKV